MTNDAAIDQNLSRWQSQERGTFSVPTSNVSRVPGLSALTRNGGVELGQTLQAK
jgi:hypothetical protein